MTVSMTLMYIFSYGLTKRWTMRTASAARLIRNWGEKREGGEGGKERGREGERERVKGRGRERKRGGREGRREGERERERERERGRGKGKREEKLKVGDERVKGLETTYHDTDRTNQYK